MHHSLRRHCRDAGNSRALRPPPLHYAVCFDPMPLQMEAPPVRHTALSTHVRLLRRMSHRVLFQAHLAAIQSATHGALDAGGGRVGGPLLVHFDDVEDQLLRAYERGRTLLTHVRPCAVHMLVVHVSPHLVRCGEEGVAGVAHVALVAVWVDAYDGRTCSVLRFRVAPVVVLQVVLPCLLPRVEPHIVAAIAHDARVAPQGVVCAADVSHERRAAGVACIAVRTRVRLVAGVLVDVVLQSNAGGEQPLAVRAGLTEESAASGGRYVVHLDLMSVARVTSSERLGTVLTWHTWTSGRRSGSGCGGLSGSGRGRRAGGQWRR